MSLAEPVGLCEGDQPRPLRDVMLHHQHAAGTQQSRRSHHDPLRYQRAVGGAAIQRRLRIMVAHFGLFGDLRFGDVRRIRDHHVDGAVKLGQRRAAGGIAELEMIIIGGQRVET